LDCEVLDHSDMQKQMEKRFMIGGRLFTAHGGGVPLIIISRYEYDIKVERV